MLSAAKHLYADRSGARLGPLTTGAETLPLRYTQGQGDIQTDAEARELEERIGENVAELLESI